MCFLVFLAHFGVICISPAWVMRACRFRLSFSGLIEDKVFSLSLMFFGGRISDLCNDCFA